MAPNSTSFSRPARMSTMPKPAQVSPGSRPRTRMQRGYGPATTRSRKQADERPALGVDLPVEDDGEAGRVRERGQVQLAVLGVAALPRPDDGPADAAAAHQGYVAREHRRQVAVVGA